MNIFDILGPVMVGPSSSHTAGAVRIGYVARTLLGERPVYAGIGLSGSFAATESGHSVKIQASSLGGGRIMIDRLDDTDVHCTGENPTLIIRNQDSPGMVSEVTGILSRKNVNIATLQLYRDKKGGLAVMVIETDQPVAQDTVSVLEQMQGIERITYISGEEV